MSVVIIAIVAFLAAILTFFSGFGLGTILTPVFMLFFPVDMAIALVGVVHFFNNLFKLSLTGRHADRQVVLRFGIPAVLAAFAGAWLLLQISGMKPWFIYQIAGKVYEVFPVKFIIALLLILFALMDLLPYFRTLQFSQKKLPLGGLLSGFFGGLSGHQGALRSAFLIKARLSKEAFIGTAVVVSTFVDFTRLSIYATGWSFSGILDQLPIITIATLSAMAGAYLGNKLLKKVTLQFLQIFIAILLILISVALGAGWL